MVAFVATIVAAASVCHVDGARVLPGQWDALRGALESWTALSFDADYAVIVGDETGNLFTYESPGFNLTTPVLGASLSKWPSAVMISSLVADGVLSFDDLASKHLRWWSTDPKDPRSRVTLRSLLSFTSGLLDDAIVMCFSDYEDCARKLYDHTHAKDWTEPRTSFQYLSGHLQFAGAMAVAASGKDIEDLFDEYLYKRYNMSQTSYGPLPWNPSMAGGITSTGQDFEHMLHALLTYRGLPKEVCEEMETDWTKAPVDPSGDGWFGHYGFGHWWECIGYGDAGERAPLPPLCTDARIQAGPGEFGFYPLIDRSGGGGAAGPTRPPYYMAVVLAEPDSLSGIPEYLRVTVKPLVDIILSGGDATAAPRGEVLAQGGGLLRRDVEYIRGELGRCNCTLAPHGFEEPYSTLNAWQPFNRQNTSRYTLFREGEGHTLFEIAKMQREKLGVCRCEGRETADRFENHARRPSA